MDLLVTAMFLILPRDIVLRESCESVEVNCFYDENGREVFTQTIFRERDNSVRAWRLIKQPHQWPQRNWARGDYSATWSDSDQLREVTARTAYQTWTQYDPELLEREFLPNELRKGLRTR